MNAKIKKLLSQSWGYGIARNIPIWHDEINIRTAVAHYPKYRLPGMLIAKLHRGTHSDFYYTESGRYGRRDFLAAEAKLFAREGFVSWLTAEYICRGEKLIKLAGRLAPVAQSLQSFFDYYGQCLPMLDTTAMASKWVTGRVKKILGPLANNPEIYAYYARPKELSPLQKYERDLARLAVKKKISLERRSAWLFNRYAWVPMNFVGEPWTKKYFTAELRRFKAELSAKIIHPKIKISKLAKKYLKLLAQIAYLNEYRKACFSRAHYLIRPVFNHLAKSHNLSGWRDISLLTSGEIIDLAEGEDNYQKKLIKRRSLCLLYNNGPLSVDIIYGSAVLKFEKKFKPRASGVKRLAGTTANGGVIRGTAKIIFEPKDFAKFNRGDILIAKMTSVDFIPIMKKAGAFVTDEGGLACHAAVVAREYNKPCIVGTRLATAVFKDGDKIIVDAERGIVRKL